MAVSILISTHDIVSYRQKNIKFFDISCCLLYTVILIFLIYRNILRQTFLFFITALPK